MAGNIEVRTVGTGDSLTGAGSNGRVAIWTSGTTLSSFSDFLYDATNKVTVPSGSVGHPGINFAGSNTTGAYWTSGFFNVAVAGVRIAAFDQYGLGILSGIGSTNSQVVLSIRNDQNGVTRSVLRNDNTGASGVARFSLIAESGDFDITAGSVLSGNLCQINAGASYAGLQIDAGANPVFCQSAGAGAFRVGGSAAIETAAEKTSLLNWITSVPATIPYSLVARSLLVSDSASTTVGLRAGLFESYRTVTANVTDTQSVISLHARATVAVDSGHTYTNSSSTGISALQILSSVKTGTGAIASNYAGITFANDTVAMTGRKCSIRLGTQTGGTVGNALITDAPTSFTAGDWFIFQAGTTASQFGGTVGVPSMVFNGSTSGTLTVTPAATTTSYSLTLPSAQGGASTVLSNNGSGVLSWASVGTIAKSEVWVSLSSGHGSDASNKIQCFTNVIRNTGSSITYASNATAGDTFTIVTAGIYAISYSANPADAFSAQAGITLNQADLTKLPASGIAAGELLAAGQPGPSNQAGCSSWTGWLAANDVIRACSAIATSAKIENAFYITRLA